MSKAHTHGDSHEATVLPDGVRYDLPRRGPTERKGGRCLIAFGAIFAGFSLFWIIGASGLLGGRSPSSPLFGLSGLPFMLGGLGVMLGGLVVAFGRMAVEVRAGRVASVIRLGPVVVRPTRAPVDRIRRFFIRKRESRDGKGVPPAATSHRLGAVLDDGKEIGLAWGRREQLNTLARTLAEQCDLAVPDRFGAEGAPAIDEAREETGADGEHVAKSPPPLQPVGSRVILTHTPDGLTLEIPATGMRGPARGVLIFAVLWMVVTGLLGAVFIVVTIGKGQALPLVPLLVIPSFVVIGVAFVVGAVSAARRRAIVDVVGGAVLVTQKGLFKVRQWQWEPGELRSIVVGPSGTEVNDRPIMQIHFVPHSGDKTGLFTWREEAELAWMARTLRDAAIPRPASGSGSVSGPA